MSGINLTFSPGTELQMNFQLGGGGAGGILTAIQFTATATGTGQSFTSGSLTRYSTSSQALVAVNGVILPDLALTWCL